MSPIEIIANGQSAMTLRLDATIGRAHLSRLHAAARCYGHEQFKLSRASGVWVISPIAGAENPTLVNDNPLTAPMPVVDGMAVSVRGAAELTLIFKVAESAATPVPATSPAPAPSGAPPIPASGSPPPMFTLAFWARPWPLGRWLGIPVCIEPWAVVCAGLLVLLGLVRGGVSGMHGQFVTVLMLLFSVIAHEFGHALAARQSGIGTRQVRLVPLGGYAELDRAPASLKEECLIVGAGPAVNLLLAALSYPFSGQATVQQWCLVNISLCIFNLVPVFPLDGSRLLRALLYPRVAPARITPLMQTVARVSAALVATAALILRRTDLFLAFFFLWNAAHRPVPPLSLRDSAAPAPLPPPTAASAGLATAVARSTGTLAAQIRTWWRSEGVRRSMAGCVTLITTLIAGLGAAASSRAASGAGRTRVREGDSTFGRVILTVDGDRVRLGDSAYGQVVMRFDGNLIRKGDSTFGPILANVDGSRVREGDSRFGRTIANIAANKVREGDSTFGRVLATTEGGRMSAAAAAVHLRLT